MNRSREIAQAYLEDFGIDWRQIEGKKILDLGSADASFGNEARKRGIFVVSLDINPEFHRKARHLQTTTLRNIPYIKGDMVHLPFQDHTFDLAMAHSIGGIERLELGVLIETNEIESNYDICQNITETLRVLKKGGEYWIGPIIGGEKALMFYRNIYAETEKREISTRWRKEVYFALKK